MTSLKNLAVNQSNIDIYPSIQETIPSGRWFDFLQKVFYKNVWKTSFLITLFILALICCFIPFFYYFYGCPFT